MWVACRMDKKIIHYTLTGKPIPPSGITEDQWRAIVRKVNSDGKVRMPRDVDAYLHSLTANYRKRFESK